MTAAPDLTSIDVAPLLAPAGREDAAAVEQVAAAIDRSCRETGFFLVTGHGVDPGLLDRLEAAARAFFGRPEGEKSAIAMARGGRAWRGWFPEGGELTSGRPDHKEGIYFGSELRPDDPRVIASLPLHGPNLFPAEPPELRVTVLAWIDAMTALGHALAGGLGVALGLGRGWFDEHLTADPTLLFRIFRYPPRPAGDEGWGVAEHTDYGLLTILAHDGRPGLQVRHPDGAWIDVRADRQTFVVNLGDMLDRMTGGAYRSTPHRVRHVPPAGDAAAPDRLSFPFFFDPSWDAEVGPLPVGGRAVDDSDTRWDGANVHEWEGTYGDYLTAKVAKVFPALGAAIDL